MRRLHVALAVADLETTVQDYSHRLGARPVAVVPGKYALWRTTEVNLSVSAGGGTRFGLRHVGFEDDAVAAKSESIDVNGLMWEEFNSAFQDQAIVDVYGEPLR